MGTKGQIAKEKSMPKNLPYQIPEGYFQTFPDKLAARLPGKNMKQNRKVLFNLNRYAAAAVLIIAALIVGYLILRSPAEIMEYKPLQNEISEMVEKDIYSFDEALIYEAADNTNEAQNDETVDYLLNESLDESELINAL